MILRFRVFEQTLSLQPTKAEPRQGSKNYLELQFSFSADWDKLSKYVYLQHEGVSVPHDLTDGSVVVDEYFTEQKQFNVTLFGKSEDGSVEVPTNVVTIVLKEANNLWEKDAPEPQNSWLAEVVEARDATIAAADRAELAAVKQPYPDATTGTWWVWNPATNSYSDSGIQANGATSWNDLTDKPFYDTREFEDKTYSYDGNMDGKESILLFSNIGETSSERTYLVKISDEVPNISTDSRITLSWDGSFPDSYDVAADQIFEAGQVVVVDNLTVIIVKEQTPAPFDEEIILFPGVYVLHYVNTWEDDNGTNEEIGWISNFLVSTLKSGELKKLDEKFISGSHLTVMTTYNEDEDAFYASHTSKEIYQHLKSGGSVSLNYEDTIYLYFWGNSEESVFCHTQVNGDFTVTDGVTVFSDGSTEYWYREVCTPVVYDWATEPNKPSYHVSEISEALSSWNPVATGSFSLGRKAGTSSGDYSFACGDSVEANGVCAHAEGSNTQAHGSEAHAEGYGTKAGPYAHAEGYETTAHTYGHSEGKNTTALGSGSHAEGTGTIAAGITSHVQGTYNYEDVNKVDRKTGRKRYAHIVGNGTADDARSNAHTIDWQGNAWFAGDVTVGGMWQQAATLSAPVGAERLVKQSELESVKPSIGDNGNWFIGETDTGVSAGGSTGGGASETLVVDFTVEEDVTQIDIPVADFLSTVHRAREIICECIFKLPSADEGTTFGTLNAGFAASWGIYGYFIRELVCLPYNGASYASESWVISSSVIPKTKAALLTHYGVDVRNAGGSRKQGQYAGEFGPFETAVTSDTTIRFTGTVPIGAGSTIKIYVRE